MVDRPMSFFFGSDEPLRSEADATAREFLDKTTDYWRDWVRSLSIPFDWQEAVIRAAITLKLCNFEETGAIVAALTTSIPEAPGTQRNWDYRYLLAARRLFRHPRAQPPRHDADDGGVSHLHHQHRRRCRRQSATRRTCRRSSASPARPTSRSARRPRSPAIAAWVRSGSATPPNADPERRLRQHHPRLDARLLRPTPDPAGQPAPCSVTSNGWDSRAIDVFDQPDAGPWELRDQGGGPHISERDVLGRLRPAREDRRPARPRRTAPNTGAAQADTDPRGHQRAGLQRGDRDLRLDLRRRAISTRRCCCSRRLDFVKADDPRFVATVEAVGQRPAARRPSDAL